MSYEYPLSKIHPLEVARRAFQRLRRTSSHVFIHVVLQCAECCYHLGVSIRDTLQNTDHLPLFILSALLQLGKDIVATELVNALPSEQVWPSNVRNCPQS